MLVPQHRNYGIIHTCLALLPSYLDERGPAQRETAGFALCAPQPPTHGEIGGRNAPGRRFREATLIRVVRPTSYGLRATTYIARPSAYGLHPLVYVYASGMLQHHWGKEHRERDRYTPEKTVRNVITRPSNIPPQQRHPLTYPPTQPTHSPTPPRASACSARDDTTTRRASTARNGTTNRQVQYDTAVHMIQGRIEQNTAVR